METILEFFDKQTGLAIGLSLFFISMCFFMMSSIVFKTRAIMNKKAWEGGKAKNYLLIGLILFIISIVLLYIYFPTV